MNEVSKTPDVEIKECVVIVDGKEYKVINVFEGTQTASKLLYDMAVKRVLNEPFPRMENISKGQV
jgi:hypothetical protein